MPGIPSVGGPELLIILLIVLLLFGASRIPQLGRSLGQSLREFRKGASEDPDDGPHELKERQEIALEEKTSAKGERAQTRHENVSATSGARNNDVRKP